METLFAQRLKSARIISGLSLQELADKMKKKVSRQAIHKYESGEVVPDAETIGYLSEALSISADYFYRKANVELGRLSFRKLEKFAQKDQNRVEEKTKEQLERYFEIEEITGQSSLFENPIAGSRLVKSQEDIERIAEEIREKWGLGNNPIPNTIELLEENHIKVVELYEDSSFEGLQTTTATGVPVIVINSTKKLCNVRKRFTALHELSHLFLKFEDDISHKQEEKYCHALAGALLIPRRAIFDEIGEKRNNITIKELGIIKEQFGISIQALIFRLADLNVISKKYLNYLWDHIVLMDWRFDEPYPYIGKEASSRFERLVLRALSKEEISISKAASLKNMRLTEFRKSLMFA